MHESLVILEPFIPLDNLLPKKGQPHHLRLNIPFLDQIIPINLFNSQIPFFMFMLNNTN